MPPRPPADVEPAAVVSRRRDELMSKSIKRKVWRDVLVLAGLTTAVWVGRSIAEPPATQPTTQKAKAFAEIDDHALHNAHRVTDRVISGAQPEGEAAFAALQKLGVKTILSVDGAKPDIELAHKYGMTYVHLPIGYDGVTPQRGREIAKAIEEKPGPVYVHCHHGKHRSAAAVAVACVYDGSLRPDQAEAVLQTFGTGKNYKGLWAAARAAEKLDPKELAALKIDFVETAKIADLTEHMVRVDQHWEHVKQVQKAGWKAPADHPDLDPAHEVLQVQEHLFESGRLESHADRPERYRKMLTQSVDGTKSLGDLLRAKPVDAAAADKAFKQVAASCVSCHQAFRD
jgi:protein tyrosine phosphatase (PTP) superfamily phosphohydrolase (DUF442 family)